jgi:glutamate formiminotransferase/formiminotetrahydrofolate cyclodeaminase
VGAGRFYLRRQGKSPFVPVADLLENAVFSMGLADVAPFEPEKKVLGLPARDGALAAMTCSGFADEVSRDTPAPGGGSIAALAGALGAGLASMVANLALGGAGGPAAPDEAALLAVAEQGQRLKDQLLLAVDEDARAFNGYLEARRLPQGTAPERAAREAALQRELKAAVAVPWATAQACFQVMRAAELALDSGNPASSTDALVGLQMGFAGLRGGIWNVLINLKDITDRAFIADMEARCAGLRADAQALLDDAAARGDDLLAAMLDGKRP